MQVTVTVKNHISHHKNVTDHHAITPPHLSRARASTLSPIRITSKQSPPRTARASTHKTCVYFFLPLPPPASYLKTAKLGP